MEIDYTVHIWKEGNQYVAQALPLDVMSSGATVEEARHALDEAVNLFLATAREMGTLDIVLEEAGYNMTDDQWLSPYWISIERHTTELRG